jgi:hydrogenase small subunit
MRLSRRQFLKYCSLAAGALGLSSATILKLNEALADVQGTGPDVVWISGQACSGCVTSFINSAFFADIGTLALDTLDINFCDTIQAAPGVFTAATAAGPFTSVANSASVNLAAGSYVLLVEGSTPTAAPTGNGTPGDYCHVGDIAGVGEKFTDILEALATNAAAVLAIGTCSSFGGIPAARGSSTGATDTRTFLADNAVTTPVVRVPGCPPHPDWIVGTVLQYLAAPTALVGALNSDGAPREYFGEYQCNAGPCTWRYNNVERTGHEAGGGNNYSSFPGNDEVDSTYGAGNSKGLGKNKWKGADVGCLGILGCKGRKTKADCSGRKWNTGAKEEYGDKMAWCVGSRGGCHGCTHPSFPDGVGKFFTIA